MKLKSLATAIVAGGLFAVASPSFAIQCGAAGANTLSLWAGLGAAGCTDVDNDSTWVFGSASASLLGAGQAVAFNISESQGIGFDVYNVAFSFDPALTPAMNGTVITYTATGSPAELFDAANYDTNVTEPVGFSGAVSTAHITGVGVNLLLTSTDGSHAPPPSGETPFANNLTISVTDTFVTIPTGIVLNAANNSFQVGSPVRIPEPATLLLIGAALAGAGFARRRKES